MASFECLRCEYEWRGKPGPKQQSHCPSCRNLRFELLNYTHSEEGGKGRTHERLLSDRDCWLLSVDGPPSAGKIRKRKREPRSPGSSLSSDSRCVFG